MFFIRNRDGKRGMGGIDASNFKCSLYWETDPQD